MEVYLERIIRHLKAIIAELEGMLREAKEASPQGKG